MTLFRPCIDLHAGKVKQIVGGTLSDDGAGLQTNFESDRPAGYYADLYRKDALVGGHVIKLGPDNDRAAREALAAYPGGLQIGGGIQRENASAWLEAGASHVIVTSWLFDDNGHFRAERLAALVDAVGKERLVLDLSCRVDGDGWVVAMNRWQTPTDLILNASTLRQLALSCDEFLVHAADVEGKCQGIDTRLVEFLGAHATIPVTYALCRWGACLQRPASRARFKWRQGRSDHRQRTRSFWRCPGLLCRLCRVEPGSEG